MHAFGAADGEPCPFKATSREVSRAAAARQWGCQGSKWVGNHAHGNRRGLAGFVCSIHGQAGAREWITSQPEDRAAGGGNGGAIGCPTLQILPAAQTTWWWTSTAAFQPLNHESTVLGCRDSVPKVPKAMLLPLAGYGLPTSFSSQRSNRHFNSLRCITDGPGNVRSANWTIPSKKDVFKYLSQQWISQRKHHLCFANLQFREPDPVLIGPNHRCKTSILFTLRLHRIDLPCMWCLPHIRLCQTGMSAALHDWTICSCLGVGKSQQPFCWWALSTRGLQGGCVYSPGFHQALVGKDWHGQFRKARAKLQDGLLAAAEGLFHFAEQGRSDSSKNYSDCVKELDELRAFQYIEGVALQSDRSSFHGL